jgi:catechol 1,2-dioxygenase
MRGARAVLVACVPTADATRGPVYRRGAPWRSRLCPDDERGEPLTISGTVTDARDCRLIADVVLDVWQTNARGWYSNLLGMQNPSQPGAFNLRGRLRSGRDGRFAFDSVVPGRYPLPWPLTRPRHIHLIATHPDYLTLTTQIYFEGDTYNRWDPWWQQALTIQLAPAAETPSTRRHRCGVFDITLEPKPG